MVEVLRLATRSILACLEGGVRWIRQVTWNGEWDGRSVLLGVHVTQKVCNTVTVAIFIVIPMGREGPVQLKC